MSGMQQRAKDFAAGYLAGKALGVIPRFEVIAFRAYIEKGWDYRDYEQKVLRNVLMETRRIEAERN